MRRPSVSVQLLQAGVGLERGAMSLLDRGDGLGKENLRPLDEPVSAAGCFQRGERSLVNPGHVQRLQPEAHRLASQSARRLQARPRALLQVFSQRRKRSVADNPLNLRFMICPNSPAAIKAACGCGRANGDFGSSPSAQQPTNPQLTTFNIRPLIQPVYGGNPRPPGGAISLKPPARRPTVSLING